MPKNVVDISARSEIIHNEPWHLHFWELKPVEFVEQLKDPRKFLKEMKIDLPLDCQIEQDIVNLDWISKNSGGLNKHNGMTICNFGGGNVAVGVYRITSYGHRDSDVGKYRKILLHDPSEQKVPGT